jgi:polyhydroxybutyrate depolymerase
VTRAWIIVLAACGSSSSDPMMATPDSPPSQMTVDAPEQTATCANKMMQPMDSMWTVTAGGMQRTTRVHVPSSYDPSKKTPLVINLHGRTGNAMSQEVISHSIAKSNSAGFVVLHPEAWGSPTSWNAGGGCCDPAYSNNIDDSGFVAKLIDEAKTRLCLDEDRVYVMGLSNGGYLSHRIACELSDRVAAIGDVAGGLSLQTCAPTRAMPMWKTHGDADPLVMYSFGEQSIAFWKAKNKCTTTTQTFQNGDTTCIKHGGCTNGADIVFCTVAGGGHQWPGGEELPFMGKKTDAIIATDAIWDFFVAHPRQ